MIKIDERLSGEDFSCPNCGCPVYRDETAFYAEEWVPEDRGDGWQGEPYWHLWGIGCSKSCARENASDVMGRSAYR